MLERLRKKVKEEGEGGFTLIELLVVIIIIGILAAIAIPVFLNQRKKGVDASTKSDIRQIANEMESAFTDSQTYPTTVAIKGSKGNTFVVNLNAATAADATAFCIAGTNAKGSTTATAAYLYKSDSGGMQSTNGACPTGAGVTAVTVTGTVA